MIVPGRKKQLNLMVVEEVSQKNRFLHGGPDPTRCKGGYKALLDMDWGPGVDTAVERAAPVPTVTRVRHAQNYVTGFD